MYKRDRNIKLSLKHLNECYIVFYYRGIEKNILESYINEYISLELSKYIISDEIITEQEIEEAKRKEKYAICRNETEGYKDSERKDLGEEW